MEENFDFPALNEEYRLIECSESLKEMLRSDMQVDNIHFEAKFSYHVSMKNPKVLRAKCSKCSAFLSYRVQIIDTKHHFRLKSFRLRHLHLIESKSTKKSRTVEFLRSHYEYDSDFYLLRPMALKQLKISAQTFYRAVAQIQGANRDMKFSQIQNFLESRGEVRYDPFPLIEDLPDTIIFISPRMKEQFMKFGRVIYIDFTYNLVQEATSKGNQWTAGFITGLTNYCQIRVFGISLCSGETSKNVSIILKNFFMMMGRQCETVISDRGKGIIQGIKKLKKENEYHGAHLFDSYHLMKGMKSPCEMKKQFHNLYKASDIEEYQQLFEQALSRAQGEQEVKFLHKFDSLSEYFCLPFIPKTFVGLGVSSSPAQKFNDIAKNMIPRQEGFCQVLLKLSKVADRVNCQKNVVARKKCTIDFSFISGLPQLAQLLCKRAFNLLLKEILKSIHFQPQGQSNFRTVNSSTICQCGFKEKTGLPCSHTLKRVICEGGDIRDHIDDYWLIKQVPIQKERVKVERRVRIRGRPRKTRRNKA